MSNSKYDKLTPNTLFLNPWKKQNRKLVSSLSQIPKLEKEDEIRRKEEEESRRNQEKDEIKSTRKKLASADPAWKSLSAGDKRKIASWGEHAEVDSWSDEFIQSSRDVSENPDIGYYPKSKYEGADVDVIYYYDEGQSALPHLVYKEDRVPKSKLQDAINYWAYSFENAH